MQTKIQLSYLFPLIVVLGVVFPGASCLSAVKINKSPLLQFIAAHHIIGFQQDKIYVANGDHVLTVAFDGAYGVKPVDTSITESTGRTHPMNKVTYSDLWPGVDLVYEKVDNGIIESTWQLAPGADSQIIRLRYNAPVEIEKDGSLKVSYQTGWMQESKPIAWQEIDGKKTFVQVAFAIQDSESDDKPLVSFILGEYDLSYAVYIDPVLEWNTFMGAPVYYEGLGSIALDSSNNIYVTGHSLVSWGTPLSPHTGSGVQDAFVAKLNSAGHYQWHTFIGGTGSESGTGIKVDSSDNIVICGMSSSTWGTPINAHAGNAGNYTSDAFVAKLNSSGVIQWNTFMGTTGQDICSSLAIDPSNNYYIVGESSDSWGTPVNAHGGSSPYNGFPDVFVAQLNSSGAVQWNTFLGGTNVYDRAHSIAGDASGNIYVSGNSDLSWGAPVNPHSGTGGNNVFISKLYSNTGVRQWHTFFPIASYSISDVDVDGSGNIYATFAYNASWGTPVSAFSGSNDVVVLQLSSLGALQWHTFIGSSDMDTSADLRVNSVGNIVVNGTSSASWGSPILPYVGSDDVFVAELNTSGTLLWHVFLGSTADSNSVSLITDTSNNIYVNGTSKATWGTPVNAIPGGGGHDIFVARITPPSYTVDAGVDAHGSLNLASEVTTHGSTASFTVTPETGYSTDTVVGGDCPGGSWSGATYTTGIITADCSVSFTHTLLPTWTVTPSAGANGIISPDTQQTVYGGETVLFMVTPATGYSASMGGSCGGTLVGTTYTTDPINANCTVEATFAVSGYSIGGTVSGLSGGNSVVLQNYGGDDLTVNADGGFTFATFLDDGSPYDITVQTHPTSPNQTCAVSNGTGTVAGANITNVNVTCVTNKYIVGGFVSGLVTGNHVVLQNNGGDYLSISANGGFTFTTALDDESPYAVTIQTDPTSPNQTCTVFNGSGTLAGADITSVNVACVTNKYSVGGTVSGLAAGNYVVLQNNGGDNLTVNADGNFTFATALNDESLYAVTVQTQPDTPSQTCIVSNGSGTLAGANITNVNVACVTNTYTVGGTISGLASGNNAVLQNNGVDDLTVSADGSFVFATVLDDESPYVVTVQMQPDTPNQTCTVSNGSGTLAGANISNVNITCVTNTYTVGGSISGLAVGNNVVLQNNGSDNLTVNADGSFTFATALDDESSYVVTVLTQPTTPNQICTVSNDNGTLAGANVTDVNVACVPTYTVGGSVSGLAAGNDVTLQNNGGDSLVVNADGSFTFVTALVDGSNYTASVLTQPDAPKQTCTVSNGSGTVAGADVTNVSVSCVINKYTISVTVTDLITGNGNSITLQNNAGDDLEINANGRFTFLTALDDSSIYDVTILTQPEASKQTCRIYSSTGTLSGENVIDVQVSCKGFPWAMFLPAIQSIKQR